MEERIGIPKRDNTAYDPWQRPASDKPRRTRGRQPAREFPPKPERNELIGGTVPLLASIPARPEPSPDPKADPEAKNDPRRPIIFTLKADLQEVNLQNMGRAIGHQAAGETPATPAAPPLSSRGKKIRERILEFIVNYSDERGFPPSIREIGEAVGLRSSSTVHSHLDTMERLRVIKRSPSNPRSIQVLNRKMDGAFRRLFLTGSIDDFNLLASTLATRMDHIDTSDPQRAVLASWLETVTKGGA